MLTVYRDIVKKKALDVKSRMASKSTIPTREDLADGGDLFIDDDLF